jgi:molybdate transport system ATP-binding protein
MNALELIAKENLSQLLYVSHYVEDELDSIHYFVDFVETGNEKGYRVVITTPELKSQTLAHNTNQKEVPCQEK